MAESGDEYERPRKMPKTLKEKDSGKRLIVVLEKASLETVKVVFKDHTLVAKHFY
jgi:rRNA small subunit pseudouridine methyltransferase Nep1